MSKVYITDSLFHSTDPEVNTLREAGHECELLGTRDPEEIAGRAADAEALLVQFAPITEGVLAALPRLKIMVRYGIGVDNFDLDAACKHGVIASNCPGYCLDEVADHTLMLILAAARKLVPIANQCGSGIYTVPQGASPIISLAAKTIGIIGFGAIARPVAKRALAFGSTVIVHDPYVRAEDAENAGVRAVSLDELIATSDIITLHCPLTDETRGILGRENLSRTKPGVIIVNTGRGGLVDEEALIDLLESKHIGAAALDVLAKEPPEPDYALLRFQNVIVTPHIASVSETSGARLQQMAVDEIVRVLAGEPPAHAVGGTGTPI